MTCENFTLQQGFTGLSCTFMRTVRTWILLAFCVSLACSKGEGPASEPTPTPAKEDVAAQGDVSESTSFPTEAPFVDFRFDPPNLRVYRDTTVSIRCDKIGPEYGVQSVKWFFEDGTEPQQGSQIVHTFKGGLKSQMVSMTVTWGNGRRITKQKIVPLDQIPKEKKSQPTQTGPVPKPLEGPNANRWVLIGLNGRAGLSPELGTNILNLNPELIVVFGHVVTPSENRTLQEQWEVFNSALLEPALARGVVVVPVPADDRMDDLKTASFVNQAWERARPEHKILPEHRFPAHFSLRHKGLFLSTLPPHDYNPTKSYKELKGALQNLRPSELGVVASYRAPAPFLNKERYLDKAYRIHEHLVRRGVRLMLTGQSPVPFLGDYGALNVVSVGRADETCAPYPDGTCSGPSAVVIDFNDKLIKRAWIVDLEAPATIRSTKVIPEELRYYRRWNP